jgi:hypothetical protein
MRGGRAPAKIAAVLLLSAPLACTSPSNVQPYATPPAFPVAVSVTSLPPPRDDGTVPRNARFVVQLDGYPDPDAVASFGPITLRSGRANFDLRTEVDLVGQSVRATPRSLLAPGIEYDVLVSGMVTLDDRVQTSDVVARFTVGLDEGDPIPAPRRPVWDCDEPDPPPTPPLCPPRVRPVLASCAPSCHTAKGASGRMRTPSRSLSLELADPTDPVFGLVNVLSVGLIGTAVPLKRVAPGDPARSVLLRKLLGGSPTADSLDPPYPNMRVDGRRMPIPLDESQPATETLSADDLDLIQDWIFAGAPTH